MRTKRLGFLEKPEKLIEIAFSRARKEADSMAPKKFGRERKFALEKAKAVKKIETCGEYLEERLEKAVKEFPSIEKMHAFEKELLEATIDADKTKKALGQFSATQRILRKIRYEHAKKIYSVGKKEPKKIFSFSKQFFGRTASIVKSLAQNIEAYNEALRRMNSLPDISTELPTVILAGYPNTGKTTILSRITSSKAKIASYPFTTQKLQLGYFEAKYQKIQVIDTPGLLDRPIEKRNDIEKKAISAMRHLAKIIVFVLDPTEHAGYALEEQIRLLEEIKKQFNLYIIVVLNKADLASKEQIEKARHEAEKIADEIAIEGEKIESSLKQRISEKINAV